MDEVYFEGQKSSSAYPLSPHATPIGPAFRVNSPFWTSTVEASEEMMDIRIKFLFLLAAVICFAIAAFAARYSARVGLVPLGLALFVFPTLWDTGVAAF